MVQSSFTCQRTANSTECVNIRRLVPLSNHPIEDANAILVSDFEDFDREIMTSRLRATTKLTVSLKINHIIQFRQRLLSSPLLCQRARGSYAPFTWSEQLL